MSTYKIGFFGAGKMAEGILSAIADKKSVIMAEKVDARADELVKKYGVTTTDDVKGVAETAQLIFLAVRPQDMDAVAAEVKPLLTAKQTLVSIVAGKTLAKLRKAFGPKVNLIRVMPNLALRANAGMCAITAPAKTPAKDVKAVEEIRATNPMAGSIPNTVTIDFVANAQLAAGGTAAMSYLPDDIIDTAAIAKATYINVGTLLPFFKDALGNIARSLQAMHHPWGLDPVAAGIGRTRSAILWAFRSAPPTIVRGNASEIIALAGIWDLNVPSAGSDTGAKEGTTRPAGVEAVDDVDSATNAAIVMARYLRSYAPNHRAAVAVSGATDLVTDGDTVYRLPGGSSMMTKITGAGCSLGGVTATYLAVADPLTAALAASALYNRASEQAAEGCTGPGSFQTRFLDALWNVTAEDIANHRVTCPCVAKQRISRHRRHGLTSRNRTAPSM